MTTTFKLFNKLCVYFKCFSIDFILCVILDVLVLILSYVLVEDYVCISFDSTNTFQVSGKFKNKLEKTS
jgi:hypothetical protein